MSNNPEWYRFDATYRRFKYFRFLNNLRNPNWVFSPAQFSVPPKPTTGEHGFDTRIHLGDFDLTLLPKNELHSIQYRLLARTLQWTSIH